MNVAVVTGAGGGLGRRIAEGLAARGMAVVLADVDEDAARSVAGGIGAAAMAVAGDVRDADHHRAISDAARRLGSLTLWVNNAGVLRTGYVWEQSDDELRIHADVNFVGVMYGCRQAVQSMRESGGHIINIASMSSFVPAPGIAAYGASKYAVLGFSLSLQGELHEAGIPIEVSALCPDVFDTDLVRAVENRKEASLLFARKPLSADAVAEEALRLVDHPQLVRAYPKTWGTLARVTQPLPKLALSVIERMRKRS